MRTPRFLPPVSLLVLSLTACAPLRFDLPPTAEETREEPEIDLAFAPSELSATDPVLCVDGRRDGADCTGAGTLRWSVPLDGDYHVSLDADRLPMIFDARSRLTSDDLSVHIHESDGALHYVEDDLVRAYDSATGEHLWTADLRRDEPQRTIRIDRTPSYLVIGLQNGRRGNTTTEVIAVLDPADGSEVARTPLAEAASLQIGAAADEDVVVFDDARGVYFGIDPVTGEELWRVEVPRPADTDDEVFGMEDGVWDGVLHVGTTVKARGERGAGAYREVLRFDAATGRELGALHADTADEEAFAEATSFMRSAPPRPHRLGPAYPRPTGARSDPRRLPGHEEETHYHREEFAGVGMGIRSEGTDPGHRAGIACAPDSLRPQEPSAVAVPGAVHCDNPRLFVVNG